MCTGSPIERLHADLDDLLGLDVVELPDETLRAGLLGLLAAVNRVQAAVAVWVGSFDARGLSDADACRTTVAWLHGYLRMSGRAASDVVKRGRLLRDLPAVAEAAGRGGVTVEHLGQIGSLVKRVGVEAVRPADRILADAATAVDVAEMRLLCKRIQDHIDPDGPEPAELFERRDLSLSDVGGMMAIRGQLDPEGAAAVREAIDALMRPPAPDDDRTVGQRRADALVDLARGALAHGDLPTVGGMRPQVGILLTPQTLLYGEDGQPRTYARFSDHVDPPDIGHYFADDGAGRDAPVDRVGAHDAAPADGGEPGHRVDPGPVDRWAAPPSRGDPPGHRGDPAAEACGDPHEDANGGPHGDSHGGAWGDPVADARGDPLGARGDPLASLGMAPPVERAWLTWYGAIPPALAKRLACDADIWRIVLDPATGLPLDVGRAHRLVPYWIRRALYARDRGCRWPGCLVPAAWTDAHHLVAWYAHGLTRVEDLLLLCRYHHGRVHEGRWRLRVDRATGHVHVTRPDGRPHDVAPSRPWTAPTTRADPPPDHRPDTS